MIMEAKELMIGDWVSYDGEYVKIEGITTDSGRYKYPFSVEYCDGRDFAHIAVLNVDPIPLTEEMLLKNGFGYFGEFLTLNWKDGVDDCELNLRKMYNKDNVCDAFVCMVGGCVQLIVYIQELQHLLRLCELNELADNFKI